MAGLTCSQRSPTAMHTRMEKQQVSRSLLASAVCLESFARSEIALLVSSGATWPFQNKLSQAFGSVCWPHHADRCNSENSCRQARAKVTSARFTWPRPSLYLSQLHSWNGRRQLATRLLKQRALCGTQQRWTNSMKSCSRKFLPRSGSRHSWTKATLQKQLQRWGRQRGRSRSSHSLQMLEERQERLYQSHKHKSRSKPRDLPRDRSLNVKMQRPTRLQAPLPRLAARRAAPWWVLTIICLLRASSWGSAVRMAFARLCFPPLPICGKHSMCGFGTSRAVQYSMRLTGLNVSHLWIFGCHTKIVPYCLYASQTPLSSLQGDKGAQTPLYGQQPSKENTPSAANLPAKQKGKRKSEGNGQPSTGYACAVL